jgi:hypothetical protein
MRDLPEPGGPVINSDSAKDQDSVSKKGLTILSRYPICGFSETIEQRTERSVPFFNKLVINPRRPRYLPVAPAPSVSCGASWFIIFSNLTRCSASRSCMMRVFPEARKSSSWS